MHAPVKSLKTKHPDITLEQQGVKTPKKSHDELPRSKVDNFEKQINMIVNMAWDLSREELKKRRCI